MRRLVAVTGNRHERRASRRFLAIARQLFLPNPLRVAARDRTGAHRQSRQIDGDKTEASETDAHVLRKSCYKIPHKPTRLFLIFNCFYFRNMHALTLDSLLSERRGDLDNCKAVFFMYFRFSQWTSEV